MNPLLVLAGEASADRAAAAVVAKLGVPTFGMGGAALARVGAEIVADLRRTTAVGIAGTLGRLGPMLAAAESLRAAVLHRRPDVALVVGYSEFNLYFARWLKRRGILIHWYFAPQVWAARPERAQRMRRVVDRMSVILPFEESFWRGVGVDAHFVGHPSLEVELLSRREARDRLGLTEFAPAIAVLPGSRPDEVRAHLPLMLSAFERVRTEIATVDARILVAPSLDAPTRRWIAALASEARVRTEDVTTANGAVELLPAFELAVTTSATATLEAALARAVPVTAHRTGRVTGLTERLILRTEHFSLPNVLLREQVFPELVQSAASENALAEKLLFLLEDRSLLTKRCDEVANLLRSTQPASSAVAASLGPWLSRRTYDLNAYALLPAA